MIRVGDLANIAQLYQAQSQTLNPFWAEDKTRVSLAQLGFDSVNISSSALEKAENSAKIQETDQSLSALETDLKEARALGDLAASAGVSDEFRAQLQERQQEILGGIEEAFEDDFGGENPTGIEGEAGETFSDQFDITSRSGAQEAVNALDEAIANVQSEREALYSPAETASEATYSAPATDLNVADATQSLDSLRENLAQLQAMTELAQEEGISEEFRTELQSRAEELLEEIEATGASLESMGLEISGINEQPGSENLANNVDLTTTEGANEAAVNIQNVLDQVEETRQSVTSQNNADGANSNASQSIEERLYDAFQRYQFDFLSMSNQAETLFSSLSQSSSIQPSLINLVR